MPKEKNVLDYISDWFKILLKGGNPAFLMGLGWLSTFLGFIWFGSSSAWNPAYWANLVIGASMIYGGYGLAKKKQEKESSES